MLGIDYSSSDEEKEQNIDNCRIEPIGCESGDERSAKSDPMANPFDSTNYELTSSSDSDQSNEVKSKSKPKSSPVVDRSEPKLQSIGSSLTSNQSKISIFSNPFKEEETKQLEQLERHVKMSDNKQTIIGESSVDDSKWKNRSICWSYHKHQKCRFGNRCRFQHNDNNFIDIKQIKEKTDKNKKRVGITDSLVPPKRALKAYYTQQNT